MNIFERKVYRRILGLVYDNEKEKWRILTSEEIYAIVKKPTITEPVRLNRFLVLLESCLQTCMTHTVAECTVNKLLMMDRGTVRNM